VNTPRLRLAPTEPSPDSAGSPHKRQAEEIRPSVAHLACREIPAIFHFVILCVIVAVGLLLYVPALHYPFVFDDWVYLENNPVYKDPANFNLPVNFISVATMAGRGRRA